MSDESQNSEELLKLRSLVLATLDYWILLDEKLSIPDLKQHHEQLKLEVEKLYQKKKLLQLRRWFRDLSESFIDESEFPIFLKEKTGYIISDFENFFKPTKN